jgi:hypothetical protein
LAKSSYKNTQNHRFAFSFSRLEFTLVICHKTWILNFLK